GDQGLDVGKIHEALHIPPVIHMLIDQGRHEINQYELIAPILARVCIMLQIRGEREEITLDHDGLLPVDRMPAFPFQNIAQLKIIMRM
ncbi:MAG: hypothetical protein K0R75_1507, partial [Paenibacillaceae bacterium]|nr:hypothetical protein [Paenibacillaceae bacterium]